MAGAGLGSYPADKLGRRWMILTVQIIMIGACILEQLSTKWTHWLGARLLDVSTLRMVNQPAAVAKRPRGFLSV